MAAIACRAWRGLCRMFLVVHICCPSGRFEASSRRSRCSTSLLSGISASLPHCTLCLQSDICGPWKSIGSVYTTDVMALRWDPDILLQFGTYLVSLLSQRLAMSGAQLWLAHTAAGALCTALMWPVALVSWLVVV